MRLLWPIAPEFRALPLTAALLLGAPQALAQGFGLDLSSKPPQDSAAQPAESQPPPPPPPPAAAPPLEAPAAEAASTNPAERDVQLADRVKSVQRKSFLMTHRLSLSVDGFASINDAFFQKWGGGLQLAFAFSEPFSLVAHVDYFGDQETPNVLLAKEVLTAQLYATRLHGLGGLDFAWTPVYGKLAAFGAIAHFDLYLLAGFGGAQGEQGILPASEVGVGQRLFLTDWMSFGIEARYDLYLDAATGGPATIQRALLVGALATIWIPFHQEER